MKESTKDEKGGTMTKKEDTPLKLIGDVETERMEEATCDSYDSLSYQTEVLGTSSEWSTSDWDEIERRITATKPDQESHTNVRRCLFAFLIGPSYLGQRYLGKDFRGWVIQNYRDTSQMNHTRYGCCIGYILDATANIALWIPYGLLFVAGGVLNALHVVIAWLAILTALLLVDCLYFLWKSICSPGKSGARSRYDAKTFLEDTGFRESTHWQTAHMWDAIDLPTVRLDLVQAFGALEYEWQEGTTRLVGKIMVQIKPVRLGKETPCRLLIQGFPDNGRNDTPATEIPLILPTNVGQWTVLRPNRSCNCNLESSRLSVSFTEPVNAEKIHVAIPIRNQEDSSAAQRLYTMARNGKRHRNEGST